MPTGKVKWYDARRASASSPTTTVATLRPRQRAACRDSRAPEACRNQGRVRDRRGPPRRSGAERSGARPGAFRSRLPGASGTASPTEDMVVIIEDLIRCSTNVRPLASGQVPGQVERSLRWLRFPTAVAGDLRPEMALAARRPRRSGGARCRRDGPDRAVGGRRGRHGRRAPRRRCSASASRSTGLRAPPRLCRLGVDGLGPRASRQKVATVCESALVPARARCSRPAGSLRRPAGPGRPAPLGRAALPGRRPAARPGLRGPPARTTSTGWASSARSRAASGPRGGRLRPPRSGGMTARTAPRAIWRFVRRRAAPTCGYFSHGGCAGPPSGSAREWSPADGRVVASGTAAGRTARPTCLRLGRSRCRSRWSTS